MERAPAVGLDDARIFEEVLEKEWRRCERAAASLSLLLLRAGAESDIPAVTSAAAQCARRPGDAALRFGNDAIAIVLPFTPLTGAIVVAERVRAVAREFLQATVSIGAAAELPRRAAGVQDLVKSAGAQLAAAIELGGDRVCAPPHEADSRRPHGAALHNLPEPRTTFVGRNEDVARVRALLQSERAVTLAGPGGTGKTRTAIEAARGIVERFPDGVWFVDLSNIVELPAIVVAIASAMRLGAVDSEDAMHFAERLRDRAALIILDNCEHLLHQCRELVDLLLAHAPHVKVLLTTREALGLSGERIYRLPMLGRHDAVELFLERARRAGACIDDRDETIERIVARLDGMPLAIELAAGRLGIMSPPEVLAGLDDALGLLRSNSHGLPTRQQTLRALFDWSYQLLDRTDRMLFRRLAVFPSTWTLDAIEPVTRCNVEALQALVEKSLVQREDRDGHARFRLLNVTREYASVFLDEAGEREMVREWLAAHYCNLAVARGAQLNGMPMHAWLALQAPDRENYILALRVLLEVPHEPARIEAMFQSMRHWFHERARVDFRELLPLFEGLLAHGSVPDAVMAAIALAAADLYGTRDLRRARDSAERAVHFYREIDDATGAAHALERFASAQRYLEGGVDAAHERALRNGVFSAKRQGDKRLAALLLRVLSDVYMAKNDAEMERSALHESYELLRECGDDDRSGGVLGRLAVAEFWSGDYDRARETCRSAIAVLEHAGEPWNLAFQLMNLGLFETYRDDDANARAALAHSMELLERYGHQYAAANIFLYYAILARRTRQPERAARLIAYSDALFAAGPRLQTQLKRLHDELAAELRTALGTAVFERNWLSGRSMSRQQALQETAQV